MSIFKQHKRLKFATLRMSLVLHRNYLSLDLIYLLFCFSDGSVDPSVSPLPSSEFTWTKLSPCIRLGAHSTHPMSTQKVFLFAERVNKGMFKQEYHLTMKYLGSKFCTFSKVVIFNNSIQYSWLNLWLNACYLYPIYSLNLLSDNYGFNWESNWQNTLIVFPEPVE